MSDAVSSKFQKKHLISFGIPDKYHGQAMAALRDMACSRETLVGICASLAYLVSSPDTAQHTLGMSHPMQPLAHALAKRKKEIVESQLPDDAKELQDLISHKNMNAQIGEIFRSCYRYGEVSHSDKLRDAKKIKFYAEAEIKRLEKKSQ